MHTVLLLLIFTVHLSSTSIYYCGPTNNTFYQLVSQLLTAPCEQEIINFCCLQHDRCYDDCSATQLTCDILFCDCLRDIQTNFYCRNIVQSIHCNFAQWFGLSYKCIPEEPINQLQRIRDENVEEVANVTLPAIQLKSMEYEDVEEYINITLTEPDPGSL